MLYGSVEGKEIIVVDSSHGGGMSREGVSLLQHVIFSVHIIPSIQVHV